MWQTQTHPGQGCVLTSIGGQYWARLQRRQEEELAGDPKAPQEGLGSRPAISSCEDLLEWTAEQMKVTYVKLKNGKQSLPLES